jgi:hypothetical protein
MYTVDSCVRIHLQVKIEYSICEFVELFLGSLGYVRSAQQNVGISIASAKSAHLNLESSSEENVLGGNTRIVWRLGRRLKVTEYSRGILCEGGTEHKT